MVKSAINLEDVLARVQDDKDLLLELFDIFVEFYPEKRQVLEEVMAKNDFVQIKDIIHSIKGASGNIAAEDMHKTCIKIEGLALKNDMTGIRKHCQMLDDQFFQVKKFIERMKKNGK